MNGCKRSSDWGLVLFGFFTAAAPAAAQPASDRKATSEAQQAPGARETPRHDGASSASPSAASKRVIEESASETSAPSSRDEKRTRAVEVAVRRWLDGGTPPTEGCTARALRVVRERIYVACGLGGLWTLESADGEFVVRARRDLGGSVEGLFEREGQLWAIVERVEARPVAGLDAEPSREDATRPSKVIDDLSEVDDAPRKVDAGLGGSPRATFPEERGPAMPMKLLPNEQSRPANPPTNTTQRMEGEVLRVLGRDVMIDLGTDDDVRPGMRVEFLTGTPLAEHEAMTDPNDLSFAQLAVGIVQSATAKRARVRLGINERVPVGSIARPTNAPVTASGASPPRASDFWEVSALIRPFMVIDDLGGGLLLDGALGYRFTGGLHLELSIQPLGLASADAGGVSTFTTFFMVNYDTRSFEIGGGLGAQTVNEPEFYEATGSGTVMPQHLRIGALDGVHLDVLSTAVLFRRSFRFSGLRGAVQIPFSDGGWFMLFRGGGGLAGYAFGEVAMRSLTSGNGGSGSTFIVASIGGAGVFQRGYCDFDFCEGSTSYAGPTIGVGFEHRF